MSRAALEMASSTRFSGTGIAPARARTIRNADHVRLGQAGLQRETQDAGDAPLFGIGSPPAPRPGSDRHARIAHTSGGSVFGWFLTMSTASQPLISSAVMTAFQRPGCVQARLDRGECSAACDRSPFPARPARFHRLAVEGRLVPHGQIQAQQRENSQQRHSPCRRTGSQASSTRHVVDSLPGCYTNRNNA